MNIKLHKQGQTGRSMVEMLGVLAIIGVLSVGGISGFKNAMIKREANELVAAMSKAAVLALSANKGEGATMTFGKNSVTGNGLFHGPEIGLSDLEHVWAIIATGSESANHAVIIRFDADQKNLCLATLNILAGKTVNLTGTFTYPDGSTTTATYNKSSCEGTDNDFVAASFK